MNDRIEQIAHEQGIPWDDNHHWYVSNTDLKRFAELIVRESIAEMQDAFDMTIEEANHLLDYFGVEE